jgi:NAD(P)-dependent dehydrogenase (short-subunit alcohol dehydrogenase family)
MDLRIVGKRAIVTGASRGIGFAVSELLVQEGASVALVARNEDRLQASAAKLAGRGPRVVPLVADTTDDAAVRSMVDTVVTQFGGVDILVNAAARPGGRNHAAGLLDLADDDLRFEVETKVLGYLRCMRAVAPYMTAQGWGRIVNLSGLAARHTGSLAGSTRNVAVAAVTKNVADELGPQGVNVTVVHPGVTVTERTPGIVASRVRATGSSETGALLELAARSSIGRLVTAAEVAAVVVFLCSPLSVAINGDAVAVGGGEKGQIYY